MVIRREKNAKLYQSKIINEKYRISVKKKEKKKRKRPLLKYL